MKNPEPFQIENFTNFLSEYSKDPKNTILRHALLNQGVDTITRSQDLPIENDFKFSTDIKQCLSPIKKTPVDVGFSQE